MATSIAPTKEDLTGKSQGNDIYSNHGGTRYDVLLWQSIYRIKFMTPMACPFNTLYMQNS